MERIHIWQIIFVFVTLYLVGIFGKPPPHFRNPLWLKPEKRLQIYNYPLSDGTLENFEDSSKDYAYDDADDDDGEDHRENKRGFSILSRWRPFNTFGKQRASVRNVNRAVGPSTKYELVSAETRANTRPGQPLRWG